MSSSILTTIDGLVVKVTWSAPFDNFDDITKYLIEIRHKDFISFSESGDCNGSLESVVSSRECSISLQVLRTAPYLLTQDDYIVARVKAFNSFGWSIDS